jgi:hypothetical protein
MNTARTLLTLARSHTDVRAARHSSASQQQREDQQQDHDEKEDKDEEGDSHSVLTQVLATRSFLDFCRL